MTQTEVVEKLSNSYPTISLLAGDTYYWSPGDKTVYFKSDNETPEGIWALLHETGHALLDHEQYYTDVELVTMEMQAWEEAKLLAENLQLEVEIDEDHIQDCLDSYRDWLHKRSMCPDCNLSGIQTNTDTYTCVFCHKNWQVSADRFCRPYRKGL
jgi:hypothetical protein